MAEVDVVINVRYTKTTPIAPGKVITTVENTEIKDTLEETRVQEYIANMTPVEVIATS